MGYKDDANRLVIQLGSDTIGELYIDADGTLSFSGDMDKSAEAFASTLKQIMDRKMDNPAGGISLERHESIDLSSSNVPSLTDLNLELNEKEYLLTYSTEYLNSTDFFHIMINDEHFHLTKDTNLNIPIDLMPKDLHKISVYIVKRDHSISITFPPLGTKTNVNPMYILNHHYPSETSYKEIIVEN